MESKMMIKGKGNMEKKAEANLNTDGPSSESFIDLENDEDKISDKGHKIGEKKKETNKKENQNKMKDIEIEKMILNCGGLGDKLEKSVKLLEMVTKMKPYKTKAKKRIQAFDISPGKESGCKVTVRDKDKIDDLLKRFFAVLSNVINKKTIRENHFSFGIEEYIEVPGLEYEREIGIIGFEVSVVFKRKGKRVMYKKIKRGKLPKRQHVREEEIIEFLERKFEVEVE
jgi:large subunit ribosomal protein L5